MILGARDAATLPLFRMGRGFIRPKPGLQPKSYSFVSVDDLVDAILLALKRDTALPLCYVASMQRFTDNDLIGEAARIAGEGDTPYPFRMFSFADSRRLSTRSRAFAPPPRASPVIA